MDKDTALGNIEWSYEMNDYVVKESLSKITRDDVIKYAEVLKQHFPRDIGDFMEEHILDKYNESEYYEQDEVKQYIGNHLLSEKTHGQQIDLGKIRLIQRFYDVFETENFHYIVYDDEKIPMAIIDTDGVLYMTMKL